MVDVVDIETPFGEPVAEVPLPEAPLIAVLAQIRFPPIASINQQAFIGPFQERIRSSYPVLRQEQEVNVVLTPDGLNPASAPTPLWRFFDRPEDPEWKVSLASSFVALDTRRYESRANFLQRLREVLDALGDTIAPTTFDRIGVRYVDRVQLDETTDLTGLVRSQVLGMSTVEPGEDADLVHSLSEAEFRLRDATLRGRWGWLPANAQLDPLHGDPLSTPCWILDLDMYSTAVGEFDATRLTSTAERYTERLYRFFRWAVRREFLRRYGGEV
ncbi:MAG: TIGR04255 family protein [Gammaproteobacteria bacterium]|nr:TIGR04255 family protein [Acidimicrobiaceae bacterium]MYJ73782.1 TIGR04255 family protein [Gammaproteobacteria bacterium]